MVAAWMRGRWRRLAKTEMTGTDVTMSSLSIRIGDQRPFAMDIDHRRAWGLRVLRGLSVLLGLLVRRRVRSRPVAQARPL